MKKVLILSVILLVFSSLWAEKKKEIGPLNGVQPDDAWALAKLLSDEEGCVLLNFDYGKGQVLFGKIAFRDLLTKMRTNVLVHLDDGILDVDLVDMEEQSKHGSWTKSNVTLTKTYRRIRQRILKRMHELYENPEAFNTLRHKAYADVDLHYLFLRTANKLASDRWVEKFMIDKPFDWNVTFVDIANNGEKSMEHYKYVETYTYGGKGRIDSLDNILSYRFFFIKVYTNSDRNIMQKKDTRARVAGICKEVRNQKDSFSVVMVEG